LFSGQRGFLLAGFSQKLSAKPGKNPAKPGENPALSSRTPSRALARIGAVLHAPEEDALAILHAAQDVLALVTVALTPEPVADGLGRPGPAVIPRGQVILVEAHVVDERL